MIDYIPRPDFVKLVSTFNFKILHHQEKNKDGKPKLVWDGETTTYRDYDQSIEYWNFDIDINGCCLT